jgi:malate dehydrogenase
MVAGTKATELVDKDWVVNDFIPTVQQRGAAIIKARGLSSAASAANAAIEHMRDWALGTNGKIVSMGIPSDGSYGIAEGLIYSFPVTCENGKYTIIQGLNVNDFSQELMRATETELSEERDGVSHLFP